MIGLRTNAVTATNQLLITIPDNLKGVELEVIVLPAAKSGDSIDFWSEEDLAAMSKSTLGHPIEGDDEDYTKW